MGKRKKMHSSLMLGTSRQFYGYPISFCLTGDECSTLNDCISELPDEILAQILSQLPLREAVRTGILSKRWRCVWYLVSKLEFDAVNIVGGACNSHMFRKHNQDRLVSCVNQVMKLGVCKGVNSLKVQCNLGPVYYSEIDRWLQCAVNNTLENLDIDLSKPNQLSLPIPPVENCYSVPDWIFKRRLPLKHLSLSCCTFKVPLSTVSFSCLTSLSLASQNLSQHHINTFCDCPNLRSMSLFGCHCPFHLKLASRHGYLPLRNLNLVDCGIVNLEIYNAVALLSFECLGSFLNNLLLQNSVKPVAICYGRLLFESQPVVPFYDFETLAADFPEVEKLTMILPRLEGNLFFLRLPTFNKLQELVADLTLQNASDVLRFISLLLKASPYLQMLQVMLPLQTSYTPVEESNWLIDVPKDYDTHENVREVKLYAFRGYRHELKLVKYLIHVAASLEKVEIFRKPYLYEGTGRWGNIARSTEITRKKLVSKLRKFISTRVGFTRSIQQLLVY